METKLAHVGTDDSPHLLREHLMGFWAASSSLTTIFDSVTLGRLAGSWHDLGKYRPGLQSYIRQVNGHESRVN
jgi:CRISPR-associated endonuclease/helicase Cas3